MAIIPISSPIAPVGNEVQLQLGSPALGSGLTIHAGVADNGAPQVFAPTLQPDVPRAIVCTPSGTTANVTAVSVVIAGIDAAGNPVTETLPPFTAGQATAVTSITAFKSITSISQPAIGTAVTVTYTASPKLGVGYALAEDTAEAGYLDGTREATRPVITPSTNPGRCLVLFNTALSGIPARLDFFYPG